jgi:hypothetical protein
MNVLPDPTPGRLWAVILPRSAAHLLLDLAARLAARPPDGEPVLVLDGGNCFNAYTVAARLRRLTPEVELALQRIHVARAFTSYQMLALLQETPACTGPVLVLDLPAMFSDESASLEERRRLFGQSLVELRRLCARAPVVVSAHLAARPESYAWLDELQSTVDRIWRFELLQPPSPARLFS